MAAKKLLRNFHPLQTRLIKQHLRAELENPDLTQEQRDGIAEITRPLKRLALKTLTNKLQHAYTADKIRGGISGKLGDGTILKFLFDHREEILAFIKEILALFM